MVLSARGVVCIFARNVRKHVDKSVFVTNGSQRMTVIQTRNQAWNCKRRMMKVKRMRSQQTQTRWIYRPPAVMTVLVLYGLGWRG